MRHPPNEARRQSPEKRDQAPTRAEDYAQWYQQVVKVADMAEMSGVRGCMVIKPWGYGAWELMQRDLDARFKATGHENCYFPLFIPLELLSKSRACRRLCQEMAVVTHHRLAMKDGKLVPDAELEEPLVVRPTSETVIGEAMTEIYRFDTPTIRHYARHHRRRDEAFLPRLRDERNRGPRVAGCA